MPNNVNSLLKHAYNLLGTHNIDIMCNEAIIYKYGIYYSISNGERFFNAIRNDFYYNKSRGNYISTQNGIHSFIKHWCDVYHITDTIDYVALYRTHEETIESIGIISAGIEISMLESNFTCDCMTIYQWK